MELGLTPWDFSVRSATGLTEQAAFAERLGYRSFWLPENHFNDAALPDPLMLLAGVAAGTNSIHLGTTSYLLPLRNPLLAAEQVAVLDHLSGGRVVLGVGRGYSKETLHAFDIDPGEKRQLFEWCLGVMREAWTGEPVSLHEDGSSAVTVAPRPLQRPHPPIWIAAFGPKALRQAGRLGLPYLASPIETFEVLRKNVEIHGDALRAAGHPPAACRPVMRSIFTSREPSVSRRVREAVHASRPPPGLETSPEIDEWMIIGEPAFVKDKMAEYREALSATHMVVTRLRIEGIEELERRRSIELIAELAT